jgi:hypothetical protein
MLRHVNNLHTSAHSKGLLCNRKHNDSEHEQPVSIKSSVDNAMITNT